MFKVLFPYFHLLCPNKEPFLPQACDSTASRFAKPILLHQTWVFIKQLANWNVKGQLNQPCIWLKSLSLYTYPPHHTYTHTHSYHKSMCVYVCICECIHTYVYTYICIYIFTYTYTRSLSFFFFPKRCALQRGGMIWFSCSGNAFIKGKIPQEDPCWLQSALTIALSSFYPLLTGTLVCWDSADTSLRK